MSKFLYVKKVSVPIQPISLSRKQLSFTIHSRSKMRQYGLSEARVKRVLHMPKRIETGIAPDTVAMMQRAGSEKHPHEIWVMVSSPKPRKRKTEKTDKIERVISAWKYPGTTKPGEALPEEILREMRMINL